MNRTVHGLISLMLVALAVTLAFVALLAQSVAAALAYLLIMLATPLAIGWGWCAKCVCAEKGCTHVVQGKLATMLFRREAGPYTWLDYACTFAPIVLLVIFPQFFIWGDAVIMVVFWTLLLVGVFEIFFFGCKGCGNEACPMQRKSKEASE